MTITAPAPQAIPGAFGARLRLILVLGSVTALGPMSIDLYLPAFPAIAAELGASDAAVALSLTGCLAGLALGQLVVGPLSDAFGRRAPLLIGIGAYTVFSLLCALAPSAGTLAGLRFAQGLAGAVGMVVARAVVRDLVSGPAAARMFSVLMLVTGLAPVLAPVLGGQLLAFTSWRGLFWLLAGFGVLLAGMVAVGLPETLPAERRSSRGVLGTAHLYGRLVRTPLFMGYAVAGGLAFAAVFAYVSGSPFVYQGVYQVSPQLYGVLFGINSVGLVAVAQLNGLLVGRVEPQRLLQIGVLASAGGGVWLLGAALSRPDHVLWIALPLFVVVSALGLVMPNSTALALADHPHAAGTASALLGAFQFVIGAIAGPVVGLGGAATSAVPMALVVLVASGGAALVLLSLTRGQRHRGSRCRPDGAASGTR